MDINQRLIQIKEQVDRALKRYLPPKNTYPRQIHDAMHYSIFNGGKRIRPILTIATCQMLGGSIQIALPAACAIELIHCSTLILDDLPCMDNDDFRRGKPTCHRVFGEDIAILAGYALLVRAFEILSKNLKIPEDVKLSVIGHLADAIGSRGLIGGQVLDLEVEGKECDKKTLAYIHKHKTSMLIEASIYTGALIGNANKNQLRYLKAYGEDIGMTFQIVDDILDIKEDIKKATYPGLYGVEKTKKILEDLRKDAFSNLSIFGKKADTLRGITDYIINRAK